MSPDYVFGKKIPRPKTDAQGNITEYPPQTDAKGRVIGAKDYTPARAPSPASPASSSISITAAAPEPQPGVPGGSAAADLPPEANELYGRVRRAEGTSRGSGYLYYGGQEFTPSKEHPGEAAARRAPDGRPTHAAGPGQWQPDTWNGLKSDFQKRFGRAPDFSSDDDQKRMTWLNAEKVYGPNLAADIRAGKLDTSKLAGQWAGFGASSGWGSDPKVGASGWSVADRAVAYEQGKGGDTRYMDPFDFLALLPPIEDTPREQRKGRSLARRLALGEDIEAIPTIDVKDDKGRLKIADFDGRHRAQEAIKAGIDLIPVSFHGMPKQGEAKEIEGLSGVVRPFDFREVPKAPPMRYATELAERMNPRPSTQDKLAARGELQPGQPAPLAGTLPAKNDDDIIRRAVSAAAGLLPFGGSIKLGFDTGRGLDGNTLAGAGRAIAEDVGNIAGGVWETAKIPGQVLTGERAPDTQNALATSMMMLPMRGLLPRPGAAPTNMLQPGNIEGVFRNAAERVEPPPIGSPRPAAPPPDATAPISPAPVASPAPPMVSPGQPSPMPVAAPPIIPETQLGNLARERVSERFAERAAGSGAQPMGIIEQMNAARSHGQPMTLADVPELQGMAGTVARMPGESGARIRSFFKGRNANSLKRLDDILSRYLPTGSVKRTMEELATERSAAAKPLYDEAYAGGSLAPLETQMQKEWSSASGVAKNAEQNIGRIEGELTAALAKQQTAGNVYSASAASKARRFADDKIAQQRKIATEAREAEQAALGRLRQAQQDGSANAPGAIWSPTIERLVKNPRVQAGIKRGLRIERDLADAQGRPMRTSEYAIVGADEAGEPIVGAVPNMRLLAAAKQGLDAMVAEMRHTAPPWRLTQEGHAVDQLRRTLVDELYRLNPKYREANELWGGYAESMRAMTDGQRALNRGVTVEDVRVQIANLPEGAKDFYRLGVADDARNDLLNTSLTGDKSKAIVNSEAAREKLRAIIGSSENAERFVNAIETERTMFNTDRAITGGSQTAERVAEDFGSADNVRAGAHLVHGVKQAFHLNPMAIPNVLRGIRDLRGDGRLAKNPELANEIARLLTDPDIALSGGAGRRLLPYGTVEAPPKNGNALLDLASTLPATRNHLLKWSRQFATPGGLPNR